MALIVGGTTVTGTQTLQASTLTGTASAINGSNITNIASSTDSNDAVGSYGSFRRWGADAANNSTTAGSNLEWASTTGPSYSEGNPSGTWRIHGLSRGGSTNSGASTCCIWIRTA